MNTQPATTQVVTDVAPETVADFVARSGLAERLESIDTAARVAAILKGTP